jgi:hypothetical protein
LDVESANRVPVVHGVESGHLVHAHWGHLQEARNLIHDADACEAVLALSQVEQWHDGGLLVLRRVAGEDLLNELLILCGKLEGYRGVIDVGIAMLGVV